MSPTQWLNEWNEFILSQPLLSLDDLNVDIHLPEKSVEALAKDENFWKQIQSLFPHPQGHINLNNGGVSSNPIHIEKIFTSYYSLLNSSPSFFTWKVMEHGRSVIKKGMALLINAGAEEIALFRNSTEALNNAIFGINLKAGDEVVACKQDYIKCISSWQQRALRENIKINWVELNGSESNDEVVAKYIAAFTPQTKVLHLTHVINWNGQILPAAEIAKVAKKKGIIVLLDAAHSLGLLETDVEKLHCDYLGAATHKWLSGPIAGGILYIRKEQIAATFPLASAVEPNSNDIKKFEELSIQVLPNLLALGYAIAFHLQLSRELKEARITYLRTRWTDAIQDQKNINFVVPLSIDQCKAIATFSVVGKDPIEFEKELYDKEKIHVVGFNWPNLSGIRITPNIYTSIDEIDKFIQAVLSAT